MITNINVGLTANDGLGDKLRNAFIIVNQNFLDIQDILDVVLTDSSIISISQISGLQTILDDINYQVSLIPGLQDDINSINSIIYTINQTLNSQNGSISDLYSLINDLQQQIYTKIGDAPIDGEQYVRQDGEWVISSAGGETLLQNITPDAYLGPRLAPISATSNGFYINSSTNSAVGLYIKNTENTGNGSVSAVTVGGTGSLYENYASLFHANAGYFVPYLRGKSGLNSNNDFYFIGFQGASFDFRTSNGSYGSETSKFSISNSGTVSIGVQPTLDNSVTDLLARKSDGTIVRVDKSATRKTGSTFSFSGLDIYNSSSAPSAASAITSDLISAKIGVVQKMYHQAASAPSFPAGWVKLGAGSYVNSALNIIYAEWDISNRVEYWIVQ
jgi:hypothetical protein